LSEDADIVLREKIVTRFQQYFSQLGFKKTSVDDVARDLRVSKKTVYRLFSTKEKVFYEIVSRVARQIAVGMRQDLAGLPNAAAKIEGLVTIIFRQTRQWLGQNDAFEFRFKYEIAELAFREAFSGVFRGLIDEGVAAGEFAAGQPGLTLDFIQGIVARGMQIVHDSPEVAVEPQIVASVIKLLR
jgi:AcrR family transcriptional regulator